MILTKFYTGYIWIEVIIQHLAGCDFLVIIVDTRKKPISRAEGEYPRKDKFERGISPPCPGVQTLERDGCSQLYSCHGQKKQKTTLYKE